MGVLDQQSVASGIKVLPGEPGFPVELTSIPNSPEQIFIRGKLPAAPRVAVVGSRKADDYGLDLAAEIGAGLAASGISIVSGGAKGIDTAALEGCIQAGGLPVAVLGTGIDIVYPKSNQRLFEEIANKGCLLSEYEPKTQGFPSNFAKRNRLISGLSAAVVVVRAVKESGSLITAKQASIQGRPIMAVPGLAGEELSAGCHTLIKEGALLVENATDVLKALALPVSNQQELPLAQEKIVVEADEEELDLLKHLDSGPMALDMIAQRAGIEVGKVSSLMMQMELKGLVVFQPGMVYCRNNRIEAEAQKRK